MGQPGYICVSIYGFGGYLNRAAKIASVACWAAKIASVACWAAKIASVACWAAKIASVACWAAKIAAEGCLALINRQPKAAYSLSIYYIIVTDIYLKIISIIYFNYISEYIVYIKNII